MEKREKLGVWGEAGEGSIRIQVLLFPGQCLGSFSLRLSLPFSEEGSRAALIQELENTGRGSSIHVSVPWLDGPFFSAPHKY